MSHSLGFLGQLWNSVKNQIVQPVPQELQFCEFYCTRRRCSLEVSGRCEIRPQPLLVLIKSTTASRPPEWANHPAAAAPPSSAHVA